MLVLYYVVMFSGGIPGGKADPVPGLLQNPIFTAHKLIEEEDME